MPSLMIGADLAQNYRSPKLSAAAISIEVPAMEVAVKQVAYVDVPDGRVVRRIGLYEGDLTAIPKECAVDLLAVSAFPNDYIPTSGSVIGALDRAGLSVARLAQQKDYDLRANCSFWLSRPLAGSDSRFNFVRLACFEHGLNGAPPAIVGDFFRGLFPFVGTPHDSVVAMSLFASGDAQYPREMMFDALVEAAAWWLSRGLGIRELMIVVRDREAATSLAKRIELAASRVKSPQINQSPAYDVFLSFCNVDQEAADLAKKSLLERSDVKTVFDYREGIDQGVCWQSKLDAAITSCRSILTIISPEYLRSPECLEELSQARLRHKREGGRVLFPIYWKQWDGELSLWLQLINASDCRDASKSRLADSIQGLRLT